MNVLQVAFPFARVGPDAVGGAEQILLQIDMALVAAGHRSVVIAAEGSEIAGELVSIPPALGLIDDACRERTHRIVREAIETVLRRQRIDLVHLHGVDCHAYLPETARPMVVTLHCPKEFHDPALFESARVRFVCVSQSQRRTFWESVPISSVIANGVSGYAVRHGKRSFTMVLGRVCPEKNLHAALDAAQLADIGVLVAGQTFPYAEHERYFHEEIRPRLDGKRRFIGAIGPVRKRRLLAGARCLLVPSLAAETSSLVAMEALACGTPVVAYPSGALPEIVEHGRTGFLVKDVAEMAAAIERCAELDPATCRAVAHQRFSVDRMCGEYLGLYERLAKEGK